MAVTTPLPGNTPLQFDPGFISWLVGNPQLYQLVLGNQLPLGVALAAYQQRQQGRQAAAGFTGLPGAPAPSAASLMAAPGPPPPPLPAPPQFQVPDQTMNPASVYALPQNYANPFAAAPAAAPAAVPTALPPMGTWEYDPVTGWRPPQGYSGTMPPIGASYVIANPWGAGPVAGSGGQWRGGFTDADSTTLSRFSLGSGRTGDIGGR